MNSLETAKKRLELLSEKQKGILLELEEAYGLEDEASVQEAVDQEEMILEWHESRDMAYADAAVRCQQMLVNALTLLEAGDKKSAHNANKALETLVREARRVRKEKEADAKKAQEVISLMNDIIALCDEHRK